MSAPALLVALYPPAIRQQWGADISQEVAEAGPPSWPDTVLGAVRLWLHPSIWPETISGQTRRVLAVELFAVTTVTGLLLRAAARPGVLTAGPRHPVTSTWLVPILLGVVLALPLPPLDLAGLGRLAAVSARTLGVPATALLALYLVAHSGLAANPSGVINMLMVCYYWATLALAGLGLCTLVARIGRVATLPGTRRLRLALLLTGIGLAIAACQSLAASRQDDNLALSAGLAVLAAVTITVGRDLRHAILPARPVGGGPG